MLKRVRYLNLLIMAMAPLAVFAMPPSPAATPHHALVGDEDTFRSPSPRPAMSSVRRFPDRDGT